MQWEETRARKQTILFHSIPLYCMYPDEWKGSEREEGGCPRLATCRFFRGGRRPDLARGSCRVCTWTACLPSMSTSMSLPTSPAPRAVSHGSLMVLGEVSCRLVSFVPTASHARPDPRAAAVARTVPRRLRSTSGNRYAGVLLLSRRDSEEPDPLTSEPDPLTSPSMTAECSRSIRTVSCGSDDSSAIPCKSDMGCTKARPIVAHGSCRGPHRRRSHAERHAFAVPG